MDRDFYEACAVEDLYEAVAVVRALGYTLDQIFDEVEAAFDAYTEDV